MAHMPIYDIGYIAHMIKTAFEIGLQGIGPTPGGTKNPSHFSVISRIDQIHLGWNFRLGAEQCSCSGNPFKEVYLQIKFLTC